MLNIITVTYNDFKGLKKTVDSLLSQENTNFKLIVVDGGSNDGTIEYLKKIKSAFKFEYISEKDKGIYDAMNKGVTLCEEGHVWFLNGGDTCYEPETTSLINRKINLDKLAHHYFSVHMLGENWSLVKRANVSVEGFIMSMPVCHQGVIALTSSLKKNPFDATLSIAADHKFIISTFVNKDSFVNHFEVIANFALDGVSSKRIFASLRQQYESSILLVHLGVSRARIRNAYFLKLVRAIAGSIAKKFGIYSAIQKIRYLKS